MKNKEMIPKEDLNCRIWTLTWGRNIYWDEENDKAGYVAGIATPSLCRKSWKSLYDKYNPEGYTWYERVPVWTGIEMHFHEEDVWISGDVKVLEDFIREYDLKVKDGPVTCITAWSHKKKRKK